MLSGLAQAEQDSAWAEIGDALRQFEVPDGFTGPCEMLVVSATAELTDLANRISLRAYNRPA